MLDATTTTLCRVSTSCNELTGGMRNWSSTTGSLCAPYFGYFDNSRSAAPFIQARKFLSLSISPLGFVWCLVHEQPRANFHRPVSVLHRWSVSSGLVSSAILGQVYQGLVPAWAMDQVPWHIADPSQDGALRRSIHVSSAGVWVPFAVMQARRKSHLISFGL